MSPRLLVIVTAALLALAITAPSRAQCDNTWEPGVLSAPLLGADGPIYAIIAWSLPAQPAMLVVGGEFTHIGGIAANNIAAWDGVTWQALGTGCSKQVRSLTVYNFSLIAGGEGFISAWNGSAWTQFGTPYPTFNAGHYHTVYSLAVFNSDLYAGGDFEYINSSRGFNSNIWKYNGSTWAPVFAGVGTTVYALQVFDDDGGGAHLPALYIGGDGGNFTSLRKWDGAAATNILGPYSNTLNNAGAVYALTVVNAIGPMSGGLIVGGAFNYVPNPAGGNFAADDIARFDGTRWYTMTTGTNIGGSISALRAFGPDLYVGGGFSSVNGGAVAANGIARYNGSQWFSVGGGAGTVSELREFNGSLVAGGTFPSVGGGAVPARNIAKWSGASWSAFAETFSINALARLGSRVFMGGSFTNYTQASFGAPVINRYNISSWSGDGTYESGLGWGTNGNIRALTAYTSGSGPTASNVIVAAGDFTVCGPDSTGFNIAVNRVAAYVEPSLTIPGWSPMGSGFNASVNALERFNGNTVAGGSFTLSGATSVPRLAKYAGSPASWQPLTSPDPGLNGTVWAMKSIVSDIGGLDTYLVIGGDFTSAPGTGVAALRILTRKENPVVGQSAWQAMGAGFNGSVYAIERYGNSFNARTYAAGAFTASGAIPVNRLARLNGANWEAVGNGIGFNSAVYALKSAGGYLFAAGTFTSVDGIPVNHVAKWNGSVWSDAAGGSNDIVWALTPWQTEVIAGGIFSAVESSTVPSPGMARLKATGVPWIQQQPLSQTRYCDQPVYFSVQVPDAYAASATYQWRKGGVPLIDGPTGTGSEVYNAQTSFMNIYYLSPQDNATYDCVVSNACGSVTSSAATLTVSTCCVADIAPAIGDGFVNTDDLLVIISTWGTCPAPCPPSCKADIAPPGGNCAVNTDDLLLVISSWGPCP